ncbi:unnamed protein product [Protopolystoma xenopodis]|uniref:Uncharacterized protein n=1 Tax=Protopolystoma xenopodis TaxID=117903 RepID=A0A448WGH5_9PLAT|nr:unnamed protein product [Protopolystoma xenopodis]
MKSLTRCFDTLLGTTNLHLDISDAVNVMLYVGVAHGDSDENAGSTGKSGLEALHTSSRGKGGSGFRSANNEVGTESNSNQQSESGLSAEIAAVLEAMQRARVDEASLLRATQSPGQDQVKDTPDRQSLSTQG